MRVSIFCDVYLSLPGIDMAASDRLEKALHRIDRHLGVGVGRTGDGALMTHEGDEQAARSRTHALLTQAASLSSISAARIENYTITKIVRRRHDLTGRPRRVQAPAGRG